MLTVHSRKASVAVLLSLLRTIDTVFTAVAGAAVLPHRRHDLCHRPSLSTPFHIRNRQPQPSPLPPLPPPTMPSSSRPPPPHQCTRPHTRPHPRPLPSFLLPLLLLHTLLPRVHSPPPPINLTTTTIHDIEPAQLIGTYQNLPLPSTTPPSSHCPDFLRIDRVETLQSTIGVLYILPHRFQSLPQRGGTIATCTHTPIENSPLSPESATILRRDTQTPLDRNNSIIRALAAADERFFLGVELGGRRCGLHIVPDGTVSVWVAPDVTLSLPVADVSVLLRPGSKYVYYFNGGQEDAVGEDSPLRPCIFKGNAQERGVPTAAASTSPSVTPTRSQTPSPSPREEGPSVTPSGLPSMNISVFPLPSPSPSLQPSAPFVPRPPSVSGVPGLADGDGGRVCFPGGVTLLVWGKGGGGDGWESVLMEGLRVGDVVAVGRGGYDRVIGFTHSVRGVWTSMTRLVMEGNRTLTASHTHFLYVVAGCDGDGECGMEIRRARDVRRGDFLVDVGGKRGGVLVVDVEHNVMAEGLYNPQTLGGKIAVNGFVVTTFSEAVGGAATGQALMAGWRAVERLTRFAGVVDRVRCSWAPGSYRLCWR